MALCTRGENQGLTCQFRILPNDPRLWIHSPVDGSTGRITACDGHCAEVRHLQYLHGYSAFRSFFGAAVYSLPFAFVLVLAADDILSFLCSSVRCDVCLSVAPTERVSQRAAIYCSSSPSPASPAKRDQVAWVSCPPRPAASHQARQPGRDAWEAIHDQNGEDVYRPEWSRADANVHDRRLWYRRLHDE